MAARKRKATKRKATKRKTTKRKTTKKRTTKRKATKRKTTKRKATKRKTTKRKATKRKTTKRKAKKKKSGKKRKPNPAFMKALNASANLAAVVGQKTISRPQAIKKVWAYIKRKGLQDSKDRRNINLDANLKKLFGGKSKVSMFQLTAGISKNLK